MILRIWFILDKIVKLGSIHFLRKMIMSSVGSWKRRGFICTKLAGELSVLLDIATMEIQVMTPVFDNNSNLLFDMDDD